MANAEVATLPLAAVALMVVLVAKLDELVLFVILTATALITALVVRLTVETLPLTVVALRVDCVASVAELVLLLTFDATAFIDARADNGADAIDATTATAVKSEALVCHPAAVNLVRAGGNVNVDLEPMLALAVFAVPPVLEPKLTPNAPNLGPAPIAWLGGNIPI